MWCIWLHSSHIFDFICQENCRQYFTVTLPKFAREWFYLFSLSRLTHNITSHHITSHHATNVHKNKKISNFAQTTDNKENINIFILLKRTTQQKGCQQYSTTLLYLIDRYNKFTNLLLLLYSIVATTTTTRRKKRQERQEREIAYTVAEIKFLRRLCRCRKKFLA
jgi:hypothetical protein